MPTKEELEQLKLMHEKRAQDIKNEILRRQKIEKEQQRKKDTHDKIVMGGALLKALGCYLDAEEAELLVEFLTKERQTTQGKTYTMSERIIEFIEARKKEKEKEGE